MKKHWTDKLKKHDTCREAVGGEAAIKQVETAAYVVSAAAAAYAAYAATAATYAAAYVVSAAAAYAAYVVSADAEARQNTRKNAPLLLGKQSN